MFYDPRNGPDPSPHGDDRIAVILIFLVAFLAAGLALVTTGLQ